MREGWGVSRVRLCRRRDRAQTAPVSSVTVVTTNNGQKRTDMLALTTAKLDQGTGIKPR